jgi:hypothetical protein
MPMSDHYVSHRADQRKGMTGTAAGSVAAPFGRRREAGH